jgi:hypothetical protein
MTEEQITRLIADEVARQFRPLHDRLEGVITTLGELRDWQDKDASRLESVLNRLEEMILANATLRRLVEPNATNCKISGSGSAAAIVQTRGGTLKNPDGSLRQPAVGRKMP